MRWVAVVLFMMLVIVPVAGAQLSLPGPRAFDCRPHLIDDQCTTGPHMTAGASVRMGVTIVRQGEPAFNGTLVNRLTWDTGHLTMTCDVSDLHLICDLAGANPPPQRLVMHTCEADGLLTQWACSIEYRGYF